MSVAFDTHAAVKRLRQAGFDEGQAEALSETLQGAVVGGGLAAKADLAGLATEAGLAGVKSELGEMKASLASKAELGEVKLGEVKAELGEVKAELGEVKAELGEVKAELANLASKAELGEVRASLANLATKAELAEVKIELKTELTQVKSDLVWLKRLGALIAALLAVPILRDLL
ncbi:MAG: DUF1640 domain-containing protein [Rhodospirillales bacterium]|nr:DUF1640 domain-containing protein [Rhodospirillales bacterium]